MENAIEVFNPKTQIMQGTSALNELRSIIATRPDKLVINNKQYLFYTDWQLLAAFFGISTRVTKTQEIIIEKPSTDGKVVFAVPIGFHAWAETTDRNGKVVSSAEAECMFDEQNWKGKARFTVLSMAQTRACAKALRNCLGWVVRLPSKTSQPEIADDEIADGKVK